MKNSNKILLSVVGLLITMSTLAGCQNNDSSGNGVTPQQYPSLGSCSTCGGVLGSAFPGLVGVRSASVDGTALFALDILISQNGANVANPKAILYYYGPATLQGTLRIQQMGVAFCGAPMGDYQIRPLTPSTISTGAVLSGGTFEAIGPTRIVFRVGSSTVFNPTDPNGVINGSPTNRIGLNLIVDMVGNMAGCGPLSTK